MYSQFEANERHYVRIKEITDNSYMDNPNVTLKCVGYSYSRRGLDNEIRREPYSITVRVYSYLMSYVLNELSIGDKVMIIGHSAMVRSPKGFGNRVTVAEQIYKSDWESYFPYKTDGTGTKWSDWRV